MNHLLSVLIFLPTLGAILLLPLRGRNALRWTALVVASLTLIVSLLLFARFDWRTAGAYDYSGGHVAGAASGVVQLVESAQWIPALNVHYRVGLDGLSLPMVLLTNFVWVLAIIASWNVQKMSKGYFCLLLLLQSGLLGTFLSLDLLLFYVFFEVSLLPMYFLIGIWGGPRKEYAAIKFFLYTLVGSIAMLIVLIAVYLNTHSFDLIALPGLLRSVFGAGGSAAHAAPLLFVLLLLGFLIKVPAVPLHTWLPDAHVEAPTPISMILAAVLLKMGGYGLFRVAYPLFPDAAKQLWLLVAIIGVVSIIYGALCAMAQRDFKRLVAYSSVSHMGFVVLGAAMMTSAALNGALFMMVAHGITSAMMFFLVGVLYDRAHHRDIARFGGLATTMPRYWAFATVGFFANLGLPGLCGFVGEVMVLIGTFGAARSDSILILGGFASRGAIYAIAIIACFGMILTAAYMLWTMQRIFFGPEKPEYSRISELNEREVLVLTPLTAMAILLGMLPTLLFFSFTEQTTGALLTLLKGERAALTQPSPIAIADRHSTDP